MSRYKKMANAASEVTNYGTRGNAAKVLNAMDRRKTISDMYKQRQKTKRSGKVKISKYRSKAVSDSAKYGAYGTTGASMGSAVGEFGDQPDTYNYNFIQETPDNGGQATESDLITTTTVNPTIVNENGVWKFKH